jgi:cell division septum initiation protein DivIVA
MDVMTTPRPTTDPVAVPLEGYDESTVEDFLRAVDAERQRLVTELEDARQRERRALALLGVHEAMVVTLRKAYQDVTTIRRQAEATAAATLREAEYRAAEIARGARR